MASLSKQGPGEFGQPPAKRVRIEPAADASADTPDSDMDIDDEDFYGDDVTGESLVKNEPETRQEPHEYEPPPAVSPSPAPSFGGIPGLGLWSASAQPAQNGAKIDVQDYIRSPTSAGHHHSPTPQRQSPQTSAPFSLPGLGALPPQPSSSLGSGYQMAPEPVPAPYPPVGHKMDCLYGLGLPTKQTNGRVDKDFLEAANENRGDKNAEWQYDSSDEESSSSDSSSDSSSEDDDYDFILSPEEQARILMREEGGGDGGGHANNASQLRTANEVVDESYTLPDVTITADMDIVELGRVENIVGNLVLVLTTTNLKEKALDEGSILCLADKTVVGVVAEALGSTDQPFYSFGLPTASEIKALGLVQNTPIFYVDTDDERFTKFVFKERLKRMKYTDASNMHDEEVGGEEVEFSDDEAEAEYKRSLKQAKQIKKEARSGWAPTDFVQSDYGGAGANVTNRPPQYTGGLSYDDDDDDDMYTPLQRPDNLHHMMTPGMNGPVERPPEERFGRGGFRGGPRGGHRGDSRGGFRGDRGRGRGGRNDRGGRGNRGRGGQQQRRMHGGFNEQRDNRGGSQQYSLSPDPAPQYAQGNNGVPNAPPMATMPPVSPTAGPPPPPNPFQLMQMLAQQGFQWPQMSGNGIAPMPGQQNYQAPQNQYQAPQSPATAGGSLPAGAYVNPNFFPVQQQSDQGYDPSQSAQQQQAYLPQQGARANQGGYQGGWGGSPPPPARANAHEANRRSAGSPESDRAFAQAQEKLDILRKLSNSMGSGSP